MFAPLTRFFHRRPDPTEIEHVFVRGIRVEHPREPRSRRSEVILAVGWLLILAKSFAVHWACRTYQVPVNPWWVIAPTVLFAVICTVLYWRRY